MPDQRKTRSMPNDDAEMDALAGNALARWRTGASLSTLDLRSAAHAAEREDDTMAAAKIGREIGDREALGETS